VLKADPGNPVALECLGQILYSEAQGIEDLDRKIAKLDEAQRVFERLAGTVPRFAFYEGGAIAWAKSHAVLTVARSNSGMKPDAPGPIKDNVAREVLRAKYGELINAGIRRLHHALDLAPRYDDAMDYLNRLYRERADLAATPGEYRSDISQSDFWKKKTLDTRKQKAEVMTDVTPASPGSL